MKKTTTPTTRGIKCATGLKAGGITGVNHNRRGLAVRSAVKAGGLAMVNHNRCVLSL
jgi:hypothetical protein